MKRIALAALFLIIQVAVAFAAEPVPEAPGAYSYTADATYAPAAPYYGETKVVHVHKWTGVGSWFRSLKDRMTEDTVAAEHIADARYQDLKETEQRHYQDLKQESINLGKHMTGCKNEVVDTIVTSGIILLVILALAALIGFFLRRRSHRYMADQNRSVHCAMNDHERVSAERATATDDAIATLSRQVSEGFSDMRRGFGDVRADVMSIPDAVAQNAELQRTFPLDIDVKGTKQHFEVHPRVVRGKIRTLLVASTATDEDHYAGHDEIPRVEAKSSSHLKATNARVLAQFLNGGYDDDSRPGNALQRRVCKHALDADGGHEVVVR